MDEYAQELARTVGRLRDADVLSEDIYAPIAGRVKGESGFSELRDGTATYRAKIPDEVTGSFKRAMVEASGVWR